MDAINLETTELDQMSVTQLQAALKKSQDHVYQLQQALEESQFQQQQTQAELQQVKSHWLQVQTELDRLHYQQFVCTQIPSERQQQYQLLVWEAWSSYRQGEIAQMVNYLQQSLRWSSASKTKTVSDWIKSFTEFSQQKGENLQIQDFTESSEWKKLIFQLTKPH
jgi:multidrug resistance efflux pump